VLRVFEDAERARAAARRSECVVARGAGGGVGGSGAASGRRYDESDRVDPKVQGTIGSSWTSTYSCICVRFTCDVCFSARVCVLRCSGL